MTGPFRDLDLEAFAGNLRAVRERVAPAELMLVVKDDAYRHGVGDIVPAARRSGVRWFGAFDVQTGERVVSASGSAPRFASASAEPGDDVRVFVWTIGDGEDAERAVQAGFDVGIGDAGTLELITAASLAAGRTTRVHLKIDTGLHRNGFRPEDWDAAVLTAREGERAGALRVEGVWSHISEASDEDDDAARALFDDAFARAQTAGLTPALRHLAASAASSARPEFRYEMVRVGAFAYGIRPAGGPGEQELGITPILTLGAAVTEVDGDVAVLDLGYLDGLPSTLAGLAGVDSPVGPVAILEIGALSTRVDAWIGAAPGDHVVVYGASPRAGRSATDLAELIDTVGEEIVLRTGKDDGTLR